MMNPISLSPPSLALLADRRAWPPPSLQAATSPSPPPIVTVGDMFDDAGTLPRPRCSAPRARHHRHRQPR